MRIEGNQRWSGQTTKRRISFVRIDSNLEDGSGPVGLMPGGLQVSIDDNFKAITMPSGPLPSLQLAYRNSAHFLQVQRPGATRMRVKPLG